MSFSRRPFGIEQKKRLLEEQAYQLNQRVVHLIQQGQYDQALFFAQKACDLARQYLGEAHPAFADSLNNLAALYYLMGDYAKAEPLYRRAMEISRTALGEAHPDFATSLNNLAELYRSMGDYVQAEPLLRQAMEIWCIALGEAHPDFATSLDNLGTLYRLMGDYAQAEPLLRRAMEIRRAALGQKHPLFAQSLNTLALLYYSMGNYAQAAPLLHQALEIRHTALGEAHPDFATSLNNLAALHQSMGDYAQAEPFYRQALEIRRTALGETHPEFAASLTNLGALYWSMGDYTQAEPFYRQAIEISRTALGEKHPDFAASLNNLAELYKSMGDYAQAKSLYRQALEIRRTALGEVHPDFGVSLNNLAALYHSMGDYAQVESLYRQTIEIKRTALGKDHPSFATSLHNLAGLYLSMGDYAQAEPLYRQAIEIKRTALGEDHPSFATSLDNLAVLCAATEHAGEALTLMTQAAMISDQMIGQVFSIGAEKQRMAYLESIQFSTELFLSLVSRHLADQPEAIRAGLDLSLRRKALGSEGLAVQRDAVLSGRYPELEPQLRQLTTLRQQIAQKTLAGPGPEGLESHQQLLAEWGGQQKALEAELARQIPEMNLTQKLQAVDWQAVANALPAQTVLVEFVRFDVRDFKAIPAQGDAQWQPARYLAFVLRAGEPDEVSMIDLGEAEPLDQMIAAFRAAITGEVEQRGLFYGDEETSSSDPKIGQRLRTALVEPIKQMITAFRTIITGKNKRRGLFYGDEETADSSSDLEIGRRLRAVLFDPLLSALGDYRRLLLSPDGDLSRLPFEVLPGSDGQRLIDQYEFSYLSTGRDILRFGAASSGSPTHPVVIADPDFDLVAGQSTDSAVTYPTGVAHPAGRRSQDLDRAGLHFSRLPGTRKEGQQTGKMLGVSPMMADAALEQGLKAAQSPRILHIATHGFFLPNQERDPNEEQLCFTLISRGNDGDWGRLSHRMENPLLRSGLALAGVNTWLKDGALPPEAEDGILTAEDVTGLDLLATELVVLSACETGLGEVQVGEGVFGLRRAFVLAGAKTLMMSLWKVPDQQTQELMADFYRRILSGEPRAEALRQAQLAMKEKYPNPLYWGAFICQGDPGPLPRVQRKAIKSGEKRVPSPPSAELVADFGTVSEWLETLPIH